MAFPTILSNHLSISEIIYQLGRLGWQPLASSDLKRDWEVPTILMERMLTPLDSSQVNNGWLKKGVRSNRENAYCKCLLLLALFFKQLLTEIIFDYLCYVYSCGDI